MHDQLTAYLDEELDAVACHAFEEHLANCPDCTHELTALRSLREALQDRSLHYSPPADLANRIQAAMQTNRPSLVRDRQLTTWLLQAASLAVAVLFGASLTLFLRTPNSDEGLVAEVTASHARSLLAEHLFDVASSNQHTVKPWFQGRTDFSPPVADFKDQGFALAGGRLDFVGGRTVAALVYRRRQHVINLFVWPTANAVRKEATTMSRRGYNLVHWTGAGLTFWAVSDLNTDELREFAQLVRREGP
jgi:anti-sigma factor RsiW